MGDVTALMMDVITEKSGHQVVPCAVSVCTTPAAPAPLPIPYPVLGNSSEGIIDPPMRTKINGAPIGTVGSCIKSCHGNEPGTLKEVVSLNTTGPCFIIMGAPTVLIELGMAGITGSPCISNKAITVGAPANASDASGTGSAGGGGGGGGGSGGDASGSQGPSGGGGSGGGGSNTGASGPGSSSGAPEEHQCQGGHPVDLVTGYVVDTATDISLPGVIPFVWTRKYSSGRRADKQATLGPGWAHGFEQRITEDDQVITLREAEGRSVWFEKIKPGESTFHRRERMTLHRDGDGSFRVVRIADRLTYVFSASRAGGPALLRAVRDAWDNAITLEYEGERLTRLVDTAAREIRVKWKEGRITRLEVHAEGRLELWYDYAYSAAGCLVSATDALGFADEYEYDRHHRMIAATIKTGVRFQYEYEANTGKCCKTWGPKGLYAIELRIDPESKTTIVDGEEPRVVSWNDHGSAARIALLDGTVLQDSARDEDGLLIARVNGTGEGEQYWYDARGNRVRLVDPVGGVTAWEYDERDLPTQQVTPDGLVTTFTHDDRGALTGVAYAAGETLAVSYDVRGRISGIHRSGVLIRGYEYDGRHNVTAEVDGRGARTAYAYDALGRPVSRTDALGRVTRVTYDRLGRRSSIRSPDGATTHLAYDARGMLVKEVSPLGHPTSMEYGGMGVLTRVTQPDGGVWSLAHTGNERLREIKNPRGETYRFTYDDAGRVVEESTFDGRTLKYGWNAGGRLSSIHYPDGSWQTFSHDRAGRITGTAGSDGVAIQYQRDLLGRLLGGVLEENGRRHPTVFERDAFGRVITERQGDRAIRYAYDTHGRTLSRVMPDGTKTQYAYDAEDGLVALDHQGHRFELERDVLGRELSRGHERVSIRSGYDAMDRLIDQRVTAPSPGGGVPEALVQRQWQYDRAGRLTRIDDARWGTTAYQYDKLHRLVSARRSDRNEVFAYDGSGSLIAALEGLDSAPRAERAWEVAPGNLLKKTETAAYAYDKRGRRIGKLERGGEGREERSVYRWDSQDRLREVERPDGVRVVMAYDAFGRRVHKEGLAANGTSLRGVEFVWDGNSLAADIDTTRGARTFVHEPDTLIPLLQSEGGRVFAVVNDHLGMPKELVAQDGSLAWAATHTSWGKITETKAATAGHGLSVESPFRLAGQVADEDTGLCWTRFRCFDPEVGRWLSPDPLGIEGGLNLFGFGGSPTNVVDLLGLTTEGTPHPNESEEAARRRAQRDHAEVRDRLREANEGFESGRHNEYPRAMATELNRMAGVAERHGTPGDAAYAASLRSTARTYEKRAGAGHRGGR